MNQYPSIVISEKGEPFIRKGQVWMYSNNIESLDDSIENGSVINIVTKRGEYLATGLLSKKSHIVVRILTRNPDENIDEAFFKRRMISAYNYRKTVEYNNLDNCRIVFGEADLLPGMVVDRYNDVLVTQLSTYPMDLRKDMLYKLLLEVFNEDGQNVKYIYERNDINIRTKEGLEEYKGWYHTPGNTKQIINENGLKLNVDIENGQKTGYFLDQKSNRVLVRNLSHGKRVLDCFTHTGGFALNAALGNASFVNAVDVSQTALDQGKENAKLNNLKNMKFTKADVFDYLDECKVGDYDIIILDPPAFTKSRRTVNAAYNGYKRINKQAMHLLNNEGYLITATCSRFMEIDNFEKMLKEAATESNVVLKQISVTQQNADHPILWDMNETSYLKFYIFQVYK